MLSFGFTLTLSSSLEILIHTWVSILSLQMTSSKSALIEELELLLLIIVSLQDPEYRTRI